MELDPYINGTLLIGDDYDRQELEEWYNDEKEGYASLTTVQDNYSYGYHALNIMHGFKYTPAKRYRAVLGMGSAFGEEFYPLKDRIERLVVVEPSDIFVKRNVYGIPCEFVKPRIDGCMEFSDNSFDLVTCFGVLHHIPNVSTVIGELYRCMTIGGILLVREPIISLGDWRKPRNGLTKRERGIPLTIFRNIIKKTGFTIVNESFCEFSGIDKIFGNPEIDNSSAYNSKAITLLDTVLSYTFRWNIKYHTGPIGTNVSSILRKIRPRSVFYVLKK